MKLQKRYEIQEKKQYHRNNLYELKRYINDLDVSDKVNNNLMRYSLNETPERVARLTKKYKNKEYRRIKRHYSSYFR